MNDLNQNFVSLLSKHHSAIWSYIYSLHPHRADVDDIMQETAKSLWNRFDHFDSTKGAFIHWANRFAYFEVLRFRKTRSRSRLVFDQELMSRVAETHEQCLEELQHRQILLRRCIQKLPDEDQLLISQRYERDSRIVDLSVELQKPVRRLYKRLEKLKEILFECVDRQLIRERSLS